MQMNTASDHFHRGRLARPSTKIDTALEHDPQEETDCVFSSPIRHQEPSSVRRSELLRSGSLSLEQAVPPASPVPIFLEQQRRGRVAQGGASPTHPSPTPKKVVRQASTISSLFGQTTVDPSFSERLRPTLIVANMTFKRGSSITAKKVRSMVRERLLVFPRFRSKVVFDSSQRILSAISFQEIPLSKIDLEYHVQEAGGGKGWGARELDAFISQIYSQDMDHEKPLWQFYVINQMADGSDMLMAVIDHAIGDGITMVEVCACIIHSCITSSRVRAHASTHPPTPACVRAHRVVRQIHEATRLVCQQSLAHRLHLSPSPSLPLCVGK